LKDRTKQSRLKKIQKIQQQVILQHAKQKIGQICVVLVDYFDETRGNFVGHTEFLSPTVDFGVEIVDNGNMKVGDFVEVKIFDFDGENYKGEIYEFTK